MSDTLRSLDSLDAFPPEGTTDAAARAPSVAPSVALDQGDEPVLGPLGRRLVVALVVLLSLLFIVATVWLLGFLASTSPPIPGGS